MKSNTIYLKGPWKNNPDSMELVGTNGSIVLAYSAKSVNIVAGGKGQLNVRVNGKDNNISNTLKGNDLDSEGMLNIDGQRLYNIANDKNYGNHVIEINANGNGFKIYTFTFG